MNYHEGVGHGYEAGLLAPKRDYRRFDFGIITDRGRDRIYRQRPGGGFERPQEIFSTTGRGVRVEHDRHPSYARRDLFEQLQPLARHCGLAVHEPRDVSTWP